LSNDVENILIEQAFKMQKFADSCERQHDLVSPHQYCLVDYGNPLAPQPQTYALPYPYNYNYNYFYPNHYPQYLPAPDQSSDVSELAHLKRSLGCLNLVQTRKKDRYQ
jgi:hypothetical protein